MRRTWPTTSIVLVAALVLSACGARASGNGFHSGAARTLTPAAKLAIGTIKLEGTKQAVDRAAAAKLLPLWQLLVQVNSSDSAAPQEVTAVLGQIQSTMTPEQNAAIQSMQIAGADMFAVVQQQASGSGSSSQANAGATGSSGFGGGSGSSSRRNGDGQFFFGGGGAGGGFGGGGFGGGGTFNRSGAGTTGGSGSSTTGQSSSLTAAQRAQAFATASTNALANQVIKLLESKLQSG